MAQRVRYVNTPDMVAHLWAHQSQDSARTAGQGNFYFRGDTIYSYGPHFPIARHVRNKRGQVAILFTTRSYSPSTARHKSIVSRACNHLTVFHVVEIQGNAAKQLDEYRERFTAEARRYSKARTNKPWILESMRRLVDEANAFAQFSGLRSRLKMPASAEAMAEECRAIERREEARRKRERAKYKREQAERERQHAERKAEAAKALDEWVNGGGMDRWAFNAFDLPTRLRINGDTLETSHGAEVPLDHAVKAFRVIKRLHDSGQTYERNGHTIHLGHFALDAMDSAGTVRAGCHKVEWPEIERVATLAGVN